MHSLSLKLISREGCSRHHQGLSRLLSCRFKARTGPWCVQWEASLALMAPTSPDPTSSRSVPLQTRLCLCTVDFVLHLAVTLTSLTCHDFHASSSHSKGNNCPTYAGYVSRLESSCCMPFKDLLCVQIQLNKLTNSFQTVPEDLRAQFDLDGGCEDSPLGRSPLLVSPIRRTRGFSVNERPTMASSGTSHHEDLSNCYSTPAPLCVLFCRTVFCYKT